MNDRILSFLGLCRRAGKLTAGFDAVCDEVVNRSAKLVILTADISANTAKKARAACDKNDTPCLTLNRTKDDLSRAIGRFSAVIAVLDEGFAGKLEELINNEQQEENL